MPSAPARERRNDMQAANMNRSTKIVHTTWVREKWVSANGATCVSRPSWCAA
jgi:hypothetical protein